MEGKLLAPASPPGAVQACHHGQRLHVTLYAVCSCVELHRPEGGAYAPALMAQSSTTRTFHAGTHVHVHVHILVPHQLPKHGGAQVHVLQAERLADGAGDAACARSCGWGVRRT